MKLFNIICIAVFCLSYSYAIRQDLKENSPFEKSYQIDDAFYLALKICSSYEHFQNVKDGKNYIPDESQYQVCTLFEEFDERVRDIINAKQETYYLNEIQGLVLTFLKQFMDEQIFHGIILNQDEIPNYANLMAQTCQEFLDDPIINQCTGQFSQFFSFKCHMKDPDTVSQIRAHCKSHSYRMNSDTIFHQLTGLTTDQLEEKGNRWNIIHNINRLKQDQKNNRLLLGFFKDQIGDYTGVINTKDGMCDTMANFCSFLSFTYYAQHKCHTAAIACKRSYYGYDARDENAHKQLSANHLGGVIEGKLQSNNQNILGECLIINDICHNQLEVNTCYYGCWWPQRYVCRSRCNGYWIDGFQDMCAKYRSDNGPCTRYKEHMLGNISDEQRKEINETTYVNAML